MVKMGSPSKDKDALKHSHKKLRGAVDANPVVRNAVKYRDQHFDNMWEDTLAGRGFPEEQEEDENDFDRDSASQTNISVGGRFQGNRRVSKTSN